MTIATCEERLRVTVDSVNDVSGGAGYRVRGLDQPDVGAGCRAKLRRINVVAVVVARRVPHDNVESSNNDADAGVIADLVTVDATATASRDDAARPVVAALAVADRAIAGHVNAVAAVIGNVAPANQLANSAGDAAGSAACRAILGDDAICNRRCVTNSNAVAAAKGVLVDYASADRIGASMTDDSAGAIEPDG